MKKEDTSIALLWLLILLVVVAASVYGLRETVEATSKIVVAIIGAAAVLLGAILTHALTAIREQQLELRKQRQQNYATLVEKLAPFVRYPDKDADEFTKAHLYSWVVGSPEVVEATAVFMGSPSKQALRQLLLAMRRDVGLPDTDASLDDVFKPLAISQPKSLS